MFSYAWNEFSHKQKKKAEDVAVRRIERAKKRGRNGSRWQGWDPRGRLWSRGEDAEQTGFVLKALQLIDGMRARLAIREQGAVSLRGEQETRERDLRDAGEKREAPGCVCKRMPCCSVSPLVLVLVLSTCHAVGTRRSVHRTRVCLFFFPFFLFFFKLLSEERKSEGEGKCSGPSEPPWCTPRVR